MKLPDNEDYKDHSDLFISIMYFVCIVLVVFLGYLYFKDRGLQLFQNDISIIEIETTIKDIYKENVDGVNKYYITINSEDYGSKKIEIDKGDFIKYKVGDKIDIRIKNGVGYIINP